MFGPAITASDAVCVNRKRLAVAVTRGREEHGDIQAIRCGKMHHNISHLLLSLITSLATQANRVFADSASMFRRQVRGPYPSGAQSGGIVREHPVRDKCYGGVSIFGRPRMRTISLTGFLLNEYEIYTTVCRRHVGGGG